jgi:hypothetical protein
MLAPQFLSNLEKSNPKSEFQILDMSYKADPRFSAGIIMVMACVREIKVR